MLKNFFYSSLPKTPDNLKVFAVKTLKSGKETQSFKTTPGQPLSRKSLDGLYP
jgi:hypothetical protein